MATRPRSFLRTARALCPAFFVAAAVAVAEVAWFGRAAAGFSAYCCGLLAVAWWASVKDMEQIVERAVDDVMARSAAFSDATIRRAIAEIEPTLGSVERDIHEAFVARLRVARPGVFAESGDEYRYSDPTEAGRG